MSARSWYMRIEDILESIQAIQKYTHGMDFAAWQKDQKTIDAVVRNLEIIGEAATHIPNRVQEAYADIPWSKMRSIRNILIHEYFGVDIEIVWQTIQSDLDQLREALLKVDKGSL